MFQWPSDLDIIWIFIQIIILIGMEVNGSRYDQSEVENQQNTIFVPHSNSRHSRTYRLYVSYVCREINDSRND